MAYKTDTEYRVHDKGSHWLISFSAMASPCEILIRCRNRSEAEQLASLSFIETKRLEQKFSRYRDDNIVFHINNSNGKTVAVDEEMAGIFTYAEHCYTLSDGLFDITSGVLRRAWKFDGSEFRPDRRLINSIRELVGWNKVAWDGTQIGLLPGMEIDFGGIVKEYAVDKIADLVHNESGAAVMVNFGGDIRSIIPDESTNPWVVGIEDPEQDDTAIGEIKLVNGAVATSGDVRRFCLVNGVRLGHILNPQTGWPVKGAPRSITVLSNFCTEAGLLSTLAMLQGDQAETFLKNQEVPYRCVR